MLDDKIKKRNADLAKRKRAVPSASVSREEATTIVLEPLSKAPQIIPSLLLYAFHLVTCSIL